MLIGASRATRAPRVFIHSASRHSCCGCQTIDAVVGGCSARAANGSALSNVRPSGAVIANL